MKNFSDLKLKNLFTWIVQLFDLILFKNVELKLNFGSDNWISFLIRLFELTLWKRIEFEKGQFSTKTQLPKHSLVCSVGRLFEKIAQFFISSQKVPKYQLES